MFDSDSELRTPLIILGVVLLITGLLLVPSMIGWFTGTSTSSATNTEPTFTNCTVTGKLEVTRENRFRKLVTSCGEFEQDPDGFSGYTAAQDMQWFNLQTGKRYNIVATNFDKDHGTLKSASTTK